MDTGVVIGCFNYPRLMELQINLIRSHNGPIPIFISDDCSAKSPDLNCYAELMELTKKYSDVTLWSNPQRLGHAGGDLVAFHLGIQWAFFRRFKYLIKLSQRMCIDKFKWIQSCKASLKLGRFSIASETCKEGITSFPLRTEIVLLDPAKWYHPIILDKMRMQSLNGVATEVLIGSCVDDFFDGEMGKLNIIGPDRLVPYPGIVWHTSHSIENYQDLANRFGLKLDSNFTTMGWHIDPEYKC